MAMAPASPASPAETSRLLGAVESDEIDLIVGDESGYPSYAELAAALLAEQEDVPETTLAPPSPPRGLGRLRSRCCCGSGGARLPADINAARLAVRKMAKVRQGPSLSLSRSLASHKRRASLCSHRLRWRTSPERGAPSTSPASRLPSSSSPAPNHPQINPPQQRLLPPQIDLLLQTPPPATAMILLAITGRPSGFKARTRYDLISPPFGARLTAAI